MQFSDLYQVAYKALENYTFHTKAIPKVSLIKAGFNTTFKIVGSFKVASRTCTPLARYVLRLYHPAFHNEVAIQSELKWLSSVRRHTSIQVPQPITTKIGSLLTILDRESTIPPRYCALFQWIPGENLDDTLNAIDVVEMGKLMGKLHTYAKTYKLPPGFSRPWWNTQGFLALGNEKTFNAYEKKGIITSTQCITLEKTCQLSRTTMAELGTSSNIFGLIHADFHARNCLRHNNTISILDFDTLGWGYYLYDIAGTLLTLSSKPNYMTLRPAFLSGYRSQCSVTYSKEVIDTFIAIYLFGQTMWLIGRLQERYPQPSVMKKLSKNIHLLASYVK